MFGAAPPIPWGNIFPQGSNARNWRMVSAGRRTDKKPLQAAGDLAVRQLPLFVGFDDGRLGIGPPLGGAEGVGCLQGMVSPNPAAALTAPADVDVELPVSGLTRDLDLECLGDVSLVEGAAAVGTGAGQERLVDLVDLFGAGRLAVGFGAVVLARLAAGLLGLGGGLALAEGSGLALAGAGCLVELAGESLVLGLQVVEASLKGLAAGKRDGFHTFITGEPWAATALPTPRSRDRLEVDAPNKYGMMKARKRMHAAKTGTLKQVAAVGPRGSRLREEFSPSAGPAGAPSCP